MQARQQAASGMPARLPLAPAPVRNGRQQLAVVGHQRQPRALAALHLRHVAYSMAAVRLQHARRPRAWQCTTSIQTLQQRIAHWEDRSKVKEREAHQQVDGVQPRLHHLGLRRAQGGPQAHHQLQEGQVAGGRPAQML